MKIITISREFGSGGRELGQRLASLTGFAYYDHEIITTIANQKGLSETFLDYTLDSTNYNPLPIHNARSFSFISQSNKKVELLLEEKNVIEEIARLGKDFIIVGRNADIILQEYNPFTVFVCAQMDAKVQRCIDRAKSGVKVSVREVVHQIKRIDSARRASRRILTDEEWGNPHSYQLVVNTTDWDIEKLASAVADFADKYFKRINNYDN